MPHLVTRSAAALAALFMLSSASQVSAAQITHISWDVTTGTFDGSLLATGPITGGSIDWTPPGGAVSTPVSKVYAGTWTLILTGPSGYFKLGGAPSPPGSGYIYLSRPFSLTAALYAVPSPLSGPDPTGAAPIPSAYPYGSGFFDFTITPLSSTGTGFVSVFRSTGPGTPRLVTHYFELGNEVRTIVPEPATGTLLGLGLFGLGVAAAGRGARARWRRGSPA